MERSAPAHREIEIARISSRTTAGQGRRAGASAAPFIAEHVF